MLAYAASAPRFAERRSSPNALLAIIAGHVALLAVVMSAKMDFPRRLFAEPITLVRVPNPPPPPSNPIAHRALTPQPGPTSRPPLIPPAELLGQGVTPVPNAPDGGLAGVDPSPVRDPIPVSKPAPIRIGAQLFTPPGDLKPPYPAIRLASGAEAVLQLQLTIDEHGRVIAVEPIGRADPVFLAAARRHLLAHWRYKPASEDGRAVTSTAVITLRFQLDG